MLHQSQLRFKNELLLVNLLMPSRETQRGRRATTTTQRGRLEHFLFPEHKLWKKLHISKNLIKFYRGCFECTYTVMYQSLLANIAIANTLLLLVVGSKRSSEDPLDTYSLFHRLTRLLISPLWNFNVFITPKGFSGPLPYRFSALLRFSRTRFG